jgi:hypothetical protein
MSNLISLKELINRDVNYANLETKYQVQSQKNSNYAKIVKLNKSVPDVCIYNYITDPFECSLIQFSVSDKDIQNKYLPMIGYLIKTKHGEVLGTLIYIFETNENIAIGENIIGKFNIILSNKENQHKIIKQFNEFCGQEELVYLLTEELGECLKNIIDENKN